MKRRTVVIMSFISALLSLLYVLLVYFGITRYLSLHIYSTESYSKNYATLDKADDKKRVVVAMTSQPNNKLKPTVNSLLDQTVKVNEISLNVPYGFPKVYKNVIQTYNHSVDYGDVAKLICTVMREGEEDTCIILVNDNVVYGKDFVETMMEESNKDPDKAIVAKHAVLVKPKFFDGNVIEYDGKSSYEHWLKKNLKVPSKNINYNQNYVGIL